MNDDKAMVEAIIEVASRLIVVLEREIDFLKAMKLQSLAALQDDKNKLVAAYEEQVRTLSESPDVLKRIAPALQDEFAEIAERFEAALTENRRALAAANEAQNRFMRAVVAAAEEKRAAVKTYSPAGALPAGGNRKSADAPLSLALDQHF